MGPPVKKRKLEFGLVDNSNFFEFKEKPELEEDIKDWTRRAVTEYKDDYAAMSNHLMKKFNNKYPDGWQCVIWWGEKGYFLVPENSDFITMTDNGFTLTIHRLNIKEYEPEIVECFSIDQELTKKQFKPE